MRFDPARAREGREAMKRRCLEVARQETPESVLAITYHGKLGGYATEWLHGHHIKVPRPHTRRSLYVYLHEVAHVVLGHVGKRNRRVKRWEEERDAEAWAAATMRRHGIAVPRKSTRAAKAYVARKKEHGRRSAHRHRWVDCPREDGVESTIEKCADPECRWIRPKRTREG